MEYEIIFCNDGVLRLKFGNKPLLSLKSMQEVEKMDDFSFIVNFWHYSCIFEDGLNIGSFLQCISPWSDFFSKLTGKNIKSFIDESKKPTPTEKLDKLVDFITLSYVTDIDNKLEYERSNLNLKDISSWFSEKREFNLTNLWNLNSGYRLTGYNKQQEDQYSLSASKMNEISHVPVFLEKRHFILFHEFMVREKMGKSYRMFADNAKGIQHLKSGLHDYSITYIESEKLHNLQEVVRGFFELLHNSTASRDYFFDGLAMDMKKLEKEHHKAREIINKEDNNVIEVQFAQNKEAKGNTEQEYNIDKKDNITQLPVKEKSREITVNPGAFSGLVQYYEEQEIFIDEELSKIKDKEILKIGKVKSGEPPQTRIGALIRD